MLFSHQKYSTFNVPYQIIQRTEHIQTFDSRSRKSRTCPSSRKRSSPDFDAICFKSRISAHENINLVIESSESRKDNFYEDCLSFKFKSERCDWLKYCASKKDQFKQIKEDPKKNII